MIHLGAFYILSALAVIIGMGRGLLSKIDDDLKNPARGTRDYKPTVKVGDVVILLVCSLTPVLNTFVGVGYLLIAILEIPLVPGRPK